MLKDRTRAKEFRASEHWKSPLLDFRVWVEEDGTGAGKSFKSNSLSGNERNRFFLGGIEGFEDRSLVSGLDCKEDARSFALLDYDNDGWVDIALASCNGQRLRLFRNRFGELGAKGRVVEVVIEGGHRGAKGQGGMSNRDAVGATLIATTNRRVRMYRKSIGEGLAAQNSGKIRVTLAEGETIRTLAVNWPSGKATSVETSTEKKVMVIREH